MFLAYKSISQKPKQFFHNLHKKNNYRNVSEQNFPNTQCCSSSECLGEFSSISDKKDIETHTIAKENNNNNCLDEKNNFEDEEHSIFSNFNIIDRKTECPVGQNEFEGYDIYFNMVTHITETSIQEIFKRIIASIFLLNCLESTGYFKENLQCNDEPSINDEKEVLYERILFSGLLFHAYSVILSNVHSVSEVNANDTKEGLESDSFVGIKRNNTGNCLFPKVASMVNHSCDPNTTCIYIGKTQVNCSHALLS
jgi:hypothetical protein